MKKDLINYNKTYNIDKKTNLQTKLKQQEQNKKKIRNISQQNIPIFRHSNKTFEDNQDVSSNMIYMTYYKDIPKYAKDRWIQQNKNYKIQLSLDKECYKFIDNNFNSAVAHEFNDIKRGMHKADLWRLCKLYFNKGVYADVDLVPHIHINNLWSDVTFYSCMSVLGKSIFQAFIVSKSKTHSPLILLLLISFLINKPYENEVIGPTKDMYNFFQYNLGVTVIKPFIKYNLDILRLPIYIDSSPNKKKSINLVFFPQSTLHYIQYYLGCNKQDIKFEFAIDNNLLLIERTDKDCGWDFTFKIEICITSKETIYFFQEVAGNGNSLSTCYVASETGKKILDSRDYNYMRNGGW